MKVYIPFEGYAGGTVWASAYMLILDQMIESGNITEGEAEGIDPSLSFVEYTMKYYLDYISKRISRYTSINLTFSDDYTEKRLRQDNTIEVSLPDNQLFELAEFIKDAELSQEFADTVNSFNLEIEDIIFDYNQDTQQFELLSDDETYDIFDFILHENVFGGSLEGFEAFAVEEFENDYDNRISSDIQEQIDIVNDYSAEGELHRY